MQSNASLMCMAIILLGDSLTESNKSELNISSSCNDLNILIKSYHVLSSGYLNQDLYRICLFYHHMQSKTLPFSLSLRLWVWNVHIGRQTTGTHRLNGGSQNSSLNQSFLESKYNVFHSLLHYECKVGRTPYNCIQPVGNYFHILAPVSYKPLSINAMSCYQLS